MEKLRLLIRPDEFASLKVSKSTLEFLRLEADLTDKCRMAQVLSRLEGQWLNLAGFASILKVRAVEAKDDFPSKHTWDSFFRDAKHMNELKPGERPDTIYISGLPVKWFSEDGGKTPSESLCMKIFKKWGTIRHIDVPAADPYRSRMRLDNNINKKSNLNDGIFFDVYVQYIEYVDFVKLMDSLRGMKVLKKEDNNYLTAIVKVDFDKTKHMSDNSVSRREFERKRLIAQDHMAMEKLRKREEAEAKKKEEELKKEAADKDAKYMRRKKREEKRKRKALTMFRKQEEDKVSMKIAREEQKLIKAQRQLESIRLLDELFDRIKIKLEKGEITIGDKSNSNEKSKDADEKNSDGNDKSEKKDKKSKKKKSKKVKKKKKKDKKNVTSSSDDSDEETNKKKLKSALANKPDSYPGASTVDQNMGFQPMYGQFPQPWFYDAAAMMFPGRMRGRGGDRANPMNRFFRGRGRGGFSGRRGRVNPRAMHLFNPHSYNDQYYKYFANLAGIDYYDSDHSRSRSKSRSRSWNRDRSRTRSRSRSRSRSRTRRRRRRSRSESPRSRSRSRTKSRSRSRTKSRSRSGSRRRTKSRSRSRSRRSRSKSTRRSRSHSGNKFRSSRQTVKRKHSKVKVTRAKSRFVSPKRQSRSKSWSLPKSPRQRSCSWSKNVDDVDKNLKNNSNNT
ncbi:uncharacterized protein LOC141534830 isoform X2 [Cotesia typhae]